MTHNPALSSRRLAVFGAVLAVALAGFSAPQARDPKPEDPARAIFAAFDTFPIVAIGDYHTSQDLKNFLLSLVRNPAFPNVVNDIVVEGTDGLFQPVLDRYVAGEDVPMSQARQLWRDGNNPAGANDFHAQLFQLVRRINQKLPAVKRLRIVMGEDGVDWSNITKDAFDQYLGHREEHIAMIMEREVLAKHRKALMFYGGAHVRHGVRGGDIGWMNAMGIFETKHAGVTFVISPYFGAMQRRAGCGAPATAAGVDIGARLSAWPVPSLARTKGTWLEVFAKAENWTPLETMEANFTGKRIIDSTMIPIDAYLYLGPPDLLITTLPSVFTFADKDYLAELHRRQIAVGQSGTDPRTNPDIVRAQDSAVLLCQAW